ncbi:hypothetical protein NL346_28300, partial [Klebsiella pneumoniae]|nr:hypothetical protein [Klebsiella pneumoniae]
SGLGGNDWLIGGAGADTMRGGAGADAFFFSIEDNATARSRTQVVDRILDFSRDDVLVTDVALFDSNRDGVIEFGGNRVLDLTG